MGVIKIGTDISSKDNYIADLSSFNTSNPCVYDMSCKLKIDTIPSEKAKVFDSLEKANKEGFRLCECP